MSDDFNDNTRGPQWSLVEDVPLSESNGLGVLEQGQRLEAIAEAPQSQSTDALYLSNGTAGFKLATDTDFEIAIEYSFPANAGSGTSHGDAMLLVLGVGRDLDGTDSAAMGFGYTNFLGSILGGLAAGYRVNDVQTLVPISGGSSAGTLVVSYDASEDDLTLGDGTNTFVLADTVSNPGQWNADELFVSFGVRGNGFTLASGDAWLDNFDMRSGRLVAVPEPSVLALLACGGLAGLVMWRPRRRR